MSAAPKEIITKARAYADRTDVHPSAYQMRSDMLALADAAEKLDAFVTMFATKEQWAEFRERTVAAARVENRSTGIFDDSRTGGYIHYGEISCGADL